MTFAKLSAAAEDGIRPLQKPFEDKGGINPAGTHHPDRAKVWRVLKTGNPRCICGRVTAPVTEEPKDLWAESVL